MANVTKGSITSSFPDSLPNHTAQSEAKDPGSEDTTLAEGRDANKWSAEIEAVTAALGVGGRGEVTVSGSTATVEVLKYIYSGARVSYAGTISLALTVGQDNYIYLDPADNTAKINIGGWPAGAHIPLARWDDSGSGVASVVDMRTHDLRVSGAGTDAVMNTDFDAYTILAADTDDTPAALTVAASTIVGRKATGGIVAMTAAEARAVLNFLTRTCQGRLTLTSGTPITVADVTSATTLYFTPFRGDLIALYDGSEWILYEFAEVSLNISGLGASSPYDVFIYDNGGTLTLDTVIWASTTARATPLATQDGVYVKTGAATYRYLGSLYTTPAGGACTDSVISRTLWNYYNRAGKPLRKSDATLHNYSTAAWRAWNNSTANSVKIFVGVDEEALSITCDTKGYVSGASPLAYSPGLGVDGTGADSSTSPNNNNFSTGGYSLHGKMVYGGSLGIGEHIFYALQYADGGGPTWSWQRYTLHGEIKC